jgi:lipopolysaccharide transport system ATP-binding protein
LNELVASGVSIILVTHAVTMLQRVATRTVVFGEGKIVFDGDLETGTTVYEEMMHVSSQQRVADDESSSSGIASIDHIEVLNERDQPQTEFETGNPVKLRIRLTSQQRINRARLVVALASPVHGTLFSTSTAYQDVEFDIEKPGNIVTLTYDQIPLMIGAYYFNVSLFGPQTTEFYDRRTGQAMFRITGPATDANGMGIHGVTQMKHRWNVLNQ